MTVRRAGLVLTTTLAIALAGCSAASEPAPSPDTAAPVSEVSATADPMDDAVPSRLTRATTEARTVLTSGGVGSTTTLERRAIELFSELNAEQRGKSAVIALPDAVLFDFDEDVLKAEADRVIADLVELAGLTAPAPISIVGHTDGLGADEYNAELSASRAQAVADALIARGVDPVRITSSGVGSSQPVAEEGGADDEEARARNRRVEVSFEGIDAGR